MTGEVTLFCSQVSEGDARTPRALCKLEKQWQRGPGSSAEGTPWLTEGSSPMGQVRTGLGAALITPQTLLAVGTSQCRGQGCSPSLLPHMRGVSQRAREPRVPRAGSPGCVWPLRAVTNGPAQPVPAPAAGPFHPAQECQLNFDFSRCRLPESSTLTLRLSYRKSSRTTPVNICTDVWGGRRRDPAPERPLPVPLLSSQPHQCSLSTETPPGAAAGSGCLTAPPVSFGSELLCPAPESSQCDLVQGWERSPPWQQC